jgi:Uma2 family endonuclease
MIAQQQKLYTAGEFWELAENFGDKKYELIEGVLIEMAPSSLNNSAIAMRIGRLIGNYVDERNLGMVFGADGGFTLFPNTVQIPDVSFVVLERLPEEVPKTLDGGPDLAVEIISPSETSAHIIRKTERYLDAGTKMVWNVYPEEEAVYVYLPTDTGMNVQKFTIADTLEGGDVLPGFTLKVSVIFKK